MLLLTGLFPLQATATAADLAASRTLLQGAWAADPQASRRPLPPVTPVPEGSLQERCPSEAGRIGSAPVAYCPALKQVLVDSLAIEVASGGQGQIGVVFWIAFGLSQSLLSAIAPAGESVPAEKSLQTTCLAGVILAGSNAVGADGLSRALKLIRLSPVLRNREQFGSVRQQSYALLTGIGRTESDCSAASMAGLAQDAVPDRDLLRQLEPRRGSGIGIEIFCRQPPSCPRRLTHGHGFQGA